MPHVEQNSLKLLKTTKHERGTKFDRINMKTTNKRQELEVIWMKKKKENPGSIYLKNIVREFHNILK